MGFELLLGAIIGFILTQVIRIRASRISNVQVIPARRYDSSYFGRSFPKHGFDAFCLPPEFVVVQSEDNEIFSEEFYTLLGSSTKATYENGRYNGHGYSALRSPVYLCTVVIPILVGFFPAILPFIGQLFEPLLFSGMAWMFITFWIQPLFLIFNQSANDQG